MNENYQTFADGVADATFDINDGAIPSNVNLDFIVNEFRVRLNCSDAYLAGYLSKMYAS